MRGLRPEKAKLRRWWTYLSELRLTVHHIQGVKNECADYISRNNFDALIGARSEALAKEAFSRMDVHSDLNMTMIRPLDGLQQAEYLKEFGDIYKRLKKRLRTPPGQPRAAEEGHELPLARGQHRGAQLQSPSAAEVDP